MNTFTTDKRATPPLGQGIRGASTAHGRLLDTDALKYQPHPPATLIRPSAGSRLNPGAEPTAVPGPNASVRAAQAAVLETSTWVRPLREQFARVIVGQQGLIDRLLIGLLANGHILLEGVPGLAKTLSLKTLAAATSASFQRLQFTPDMLPADIVGTLVYDPHDRGNSTPSADRFSPTSFLPTRSIAHPPKYKVPCSRRCRSIRSRSAVTRTNCPIPSL